MFTHTTPKSTPKDVFMHLLMFACLYISTVSFIALIFDYINQLFPDNLNYYYDWSSGSIRYEVASLIIVFPLYIFLANLIERGFKKEPARHEIKIRKWLVYLTLFIAALTIITDLVTLVYNFLGGELTAPFVLKILAVLLVTAAVFGYYFFDARDNNTLPKKKIAWAAGIVVAVTVIAAFFIIGSPLTQRERRFDEQRTSHLQTIQYEVINYWQSKGALPATLSDLRNDITGFAAPVDPQTGLAYEYRATGTMSFELCADFKTSSAATNQSYPKAVPYPYERYNDNWSHNAERTCFERTIDPSFYPPRTPKL